MKYLSLIILTMALAGCGGNSQSSLVAPSTDAISSISGIPDGTYTAEGRLPDGADNPLFYVYVSNGVVSYTTETGQVVNAASGPDWVINKSATGWTLTTNQEIYRLVKAVPLTPPGAPG